MTVAVQINGEVALRAHTYIVVLNWNGWQDTLPCLESLLQLNTAEFTVIVCDNGSTDDSYVRIQQWLEATSLAYPDIVPFSLERLAETAAVRAPRAKVVLMQTGSNLGFAGGCNVGLRYALAQGDGAYFWLLNNDTIVDAAALGALQVKMEANPGIGIVGSTLLYYDDPNAVQCCAGYGFNLWTARVRPAATNVTANHLPAENTVESMLRFVCGASMFVRREFLEQVGLLDEQYFLYFEEIDWTTRGLGRFKLGYASASRILHKEGSSIGSSRDNLKRSLFSERYLSRNRILFMRTHYPLRVPVAFLWTMGVAASRVLRGRADSAEAVFRGAFAGLFAPGRRASKAKRMMP